MILISNHQDAVFADRRHPEVLSVDPYWRCSRISSIFGLDPLRHVGAERLLGLL